MQVKQTVTACDNTPCGNTQVEDDASFGASACNYLTLQQGVVGGVLRPLNATQHFCSKACLREWLVEHPD